MQQNRKAREWADLNPMEFNTLKVGTWESGKAGELGCTTYTRGEGVVQLEQYENVEESGKDVHWEKLGTVRILV